MTAGIVIMAFPAQEADFETVTVKTWPLQQKTIAPQNSTFYGSSMQPGMWFQLNISSSDSVKVVISILQHLGGSEKDTVAGPFIGTSFHQKATVSVTATYWIDIYNENTSPVTLYGNVLVQQEEANYLTVYPYVVPGFLIMLGGVTTLLFGTLKKPGKPSKPRSKHKKKIES